MENKKSPFQLWKENYTQKDNQDWGNAYSDAEDKKTKYKRDVYPQDSSNDKQWNN